MSTTSNPSNFRVYTFMFILCSVCALILSILASALQPAQKTAEDLDRSKQLLITAQIFTYDGGFQIKSPDSVEGEFPIHYVPAKIQADQRGLEAATSFQPATSSEIFSIYNQRIVPFLVDEQGELHSFESLNIKQDDYLSANAKEGYAHLPQKLVYQIKSNNSESDIDGYVIPINGMGLWDRVYGYLAISKDGNHVLGTTWYWQKETAGLGANISTKEWQAHFPGKSIFQKDAQGNTDFANAPLGISVVRGRVMDVYGNTPKADSAVDGISGSTLTGNGVTQAYKTCLVPYRNFFIRLHEKSQKAS